MRIHTYTRHQTLKQDSLFIIQSDFYSGLYDVYEIFVESAKIKTFYRFKHEDIAKLIRQQPWRKLTLPTFNQCTPFIKVPITIAYDKFTTNMG